MGALGRCAAVLSALCTTLPAPPVLRVQGLPGIPVLYLYSARTYSRRYKDKTEKRKAKQTEQRAAQANKRTREEKATAEATAQVRKTGLSPG